MKSDIIPYAQEDVVRSFLDGIHPELFNYAVDFTEKTISQTLSNPLFDFKNDIDNINSLSKACSESLKQERFNASMTNLLSPMMK